MATSENLFILWELLEWSNSSVGYPTSCFDLICCVRICVHGLCISAFKASAFPVFSFLFLIEQPVRGLASGVLGDLVADEVYLYFMVIVAPPPTHSFQKKLSGQDISLYLYFRITLYFMVIVAAAPTSSSLCKETYRSRSLTLPLHLFFSLNLVPKQNNSSRS